MYVDICGPIDIFSHMFFSPEAKATHITTSRPPHPKGLLGAALGDPLRQHGHLGLATPRGWLPRAPHLSSGDGKKWEMVKLDENFWKIFFVIFSGLV